MEGRTVEWNEEYRVGIRDIDEQHLAIARCIASIKQSITQHDPPSARAALVRLVDMVKVHFMVEESLMRILDYPRLEGHADDHKQYSDHLRTLQEPFHTADVFHDRIHSLHKWWDEHIQKHDKPYALHFLKRAALGTP